MVFQNRILIQEILPPDPNNSASMPTTGLQK